VARALSQSSSSIAHGSTDVSQLPSVQPSTHWQLYAATSSTHVAPFWHGLEAHSSKFTSQLSPTQPSAHSHMYAYAGTSVAPLAESTQVAPFWHAPLEHSSLSVLHKSPL
jgi:hypothetical protein